MSQEDIDPPSASASKVGVQHEHGATRQSWRLLLGLLPALSLLLMILPALLFSVPGAEAEVIQDISQTLNQPGNTGHMNNKLGILISLILVLIVPLAILVWLYNGIVGNEERTMEGWAQVEAAYQRRADLIPALIDTVARYVRHEQNTLTAVTEARNDAVEVIAGRLLEAQQQTAKLAQVQSGKVPTDEMQIKALAQAQGDVGHVARRLLAVAESYPQLRASDQFLELQAQFEGTENRILAARNRFNEAVEIYNAAIRKVPGSLIASLGNFQRKAYFRADSGNAQAPERRWN